jgi:hypothetical protein
VAYGPRLGPVSAEVLKKRKVDAAINVSAKCPKEIEKKGVGLAKVSGSRASGGSKWPSGADVPRGKVYEAEQGYRCPRDRFSSHDTHYAENARLKGFRRCRGS